MGPPQGLRRAWPAPQYQPPRLAVRKPTGKDPSNLRRSKLCSAGRPWQRRGAHTAQGPITPVTRRRAPHPARCLLGDGALQGIARLYLGRGTNAQVVAKCACVRGRLIGTAVPQGSSAQGAAAYPCQGLTTLAAPRVCPCPSRSGPSQQQWQCQQCEGVTCPISARHRLAGTTTARGRSCPGAQDASAGARRWLAWRGVAARCSAVGVRRPLHVVGGAGSREGGRPSRGEMWFPDVQTLP